MFLLCYYNTSGYKPKRAQMDSHREKVNTFKKYNNSDDQFDLRYYSMNTECDAMFPSMSY